MFTRVLPVVAAVLLATAALTGCGSSAAGDSTSTSSDGAMPDKLVISKIPSEDETALDIEDSVTFKVLERELGIPVEFHAATSYAATIEAQRAGKVQVANYGPFSYVLAADSGVGVELVGAPVSSPDAALGYYSVASVVAGSDITSLADVAGKKVCFVDPASTSGYLFPSEGLLAVGIDPATGVTPIFAGGHDASVLALVDGQCDVAFSTEAMVTKQLIKSGQLKEGQLTQIWTSELIAPSPVTVSTSVPAELREQIRTIYLDKLNVDALKASGDCDTAAEDGLCGLSSWGYVAIDDAAYDGVRKVCETTKSEACEIANQ